MGGRPAREGRGRAGSLAGRGGGVCGCIAALQSMSAPAALVPTSAFPHLWPAAVRGVAPGLCRPTAPSRCCGMWPSAAAAPWQRASSCPPPTCARACRRLQGGRREGCMMRASTARHRGLCVGPTLGLGNAGQPGCVFTKQDFPNSAACWSSHTLVQAWSREGPCRRSLTAAWQRELKRQDGNTAAAAHRSWPGAALAAPASQCKPGSRSWPAAREVYVLLLWRLPPCPFASGPALCRACQRPGSPSWQARHSRHTEQAAR